MASATTLEAISREDLDSLGVTLDSLELRDPQAFDSDAWPHGLHVASYLATFDLGAARAVVERAPPSSSTLSSARKVLESLEDADFVGFWIALDDLLAQCPEEHVGLLHRVALVVRSHIVKIACRSFKVIQSTKFAALMGLRENEALEHAIQLGAKMTASGMLELPVASSDARLTESEMEAMQRVLVSLQ